METINNVVREIAIIVILASFLEMLLPKSSMRRFVQVVLGLFILITILNPVANLFTSEEFSFQVEAWQYRPETKEHQLEDILAQGQQLYQTAEQATVRDYEMRLEKQMESLIQLVPGTDEVLIDVQVGQGQSGSLGEIERVVVRFQSDTNTQPQSIGIGIDSDLESVEPVEIERVFIELGQESQEMSQQKVSELRQQEQDVIALISNFYGLATSEIEVITE